MGLVPARVGPLIIYFFGKNEEIAGGKKVLIIEKLEGRIMARVEEKDHIFEVNFDELVVEDVVLKFFMGGERVGSVYNDDGTERLMGRLEVAGEEDFISVELEKDFVSGILERAEKECVIREEGSTVEAYRKRMGLKRE